MQIIESTILAAPIHAHARLLQTYQKIFHAMPAYSVHAPGRIEVLGNHTDYNQGQVLSMAINRYLSIYLRPISGSTCYFANPFVQGHAIGTLDLTQLEIAENNTQYSWLNYVRGIIILLQRKGWRIPAFEAYVHSDIPLSAGLSSSAALEMACLSAFEVLCQTELSLYDKARLGQQCEQEFMGARTGLMDQFTILSAQKDYLLWSEYKSLSRTHVPMPSDYCFVLADSYVKHDLTTTYNDRRDSCEAVLTIVQQDLAIESLSDLSLDKLSEYKTKVREEDYRRAIHILGENNRVKQAIQALENNHLDIFGRLLFESHTSSQMYFENSCPELDLLVKHAHQDPLCLGARLSGGGFGGMSIHLVTRANADLYSQNIAKVLPIDPNVNTSHLLCQSAQGVYILSL